MKKSTPLSLELNRQKYRDNFQLLLSSVGTPEHQNYSQIEKKLDREQVVIMRELMIPTGNPCPAQLSKYCHECSGYTNTRHGKKGRVEAKGWENDAVKCSLKY